ncbi:hypothetical protein [Alicyclobacillus ferrooxydans]|uniref:Uncharacterized protein n=1 Tax=Alicyclobacillus ferrooxydans TaxID=471514 RepID=A0A0P9GQQ1_9BACL|nr:hypothetical protein [Alicyclobacillus ferrooxydans]KPV43203.1 hypothetical protein AN477_13150 [Alicyclobacillus ferrooxydans]
MSRRIESGLVVAIGALTVLTTATVIHDQNAGTTASDPVARWVSQGWKHVESWMNNQTTTPVIAKPSPPAKETGSRSAGTANANATGEPSAPRQPSSQDVVKGANSALPQPRATAVTALTGERSASTAMSQLGSTLQLQGWTTADVQALSGIITRLVASMTPSDWTNVEQALGSSNSTAAQQELMKVLNTHLSTTDKQWLLMHFQGRAAFSKVDVQLLQQAVLELKNDLTSGEQTLLQQQVGQLLGGTASAP